MKQTAKWVGFALIMFRHTIEFLPNWQSRNEQHLTLLLKTAFQKGQAISWYLRLSISNSGNYSFLHPTRKEFLKCLSKIHIHLVTGNIKAILSPTCGEHHFCSSNLFIKEQYLCQEFKWNKCPSWWEVSTLIWNCKVRILNSSFCDLAFATST